MLLSNPKIKLAVDALRRGDVIAYPTEAVWGLGADPFNYQAIQSVLDLKRRPKEKGLILICGDISHIAFLLKGLSRDEITLLESRWPGHTTWLIPHNNRIPDSVSGDSECVAVRVSTHPCVRALCQKFSGPIISTSANPQGYNPARTSCKARQYFAKQGVVFAPGVVGKESKPSTIIDLRSRKVLR